MAIHRAPIAATLQNAWLKALQAADAALARNRLREARNALTDEVVAALGSEGVYVTSIDRLLGAAAPAWLDAIAAARALISDRVTGKRVHWHRSTASIDLAHGELLARLPALYLFGLDATLLSIAEQYLRVPVAYHGAVLRHSPVDGRQVGPRRWHRDAEDFHVLRTVLYLSDVTEDGGPFEYVPRGLQDQASRAIGRSGMCTDDRMAAKVPREQWKRCVGPAGTIVIADSAQVFHHESLQRDAPRTVLMLGHASRRPRSRAIAQAHFPVQQHAVALDALVPPALRPCVFDWRRPVASLPGGTPEASTSVLGDFMPG